MTQLLFNAFLMNTASHYHHGQWRQPVARQADFNDVDVWIDLAKRLEAGLFDGIFFADQVGVQGPADGDFSGNVREGLHIPSNDPAVLLSALAVHTEHLGLAFTSSIVQEHPFDFARKVSTLDHISRGRVAWNIVTSAVENTARNFGLDHLPEREERYRWAAEYVDVVYKLWEGSWDEGAVLKDRERGIYSDPAKVHRIHHVGERYRVLGPHLPSPSPQRTPVLFQAGASGPGKAFAARNAEAVFIAAPTPEVARAVIAETRALAVEAGRRAEDIKFFQALTFVIGDTEEEARAQEAHLESFISPGGYLIQLNYGNRPDGTPYPLDTPLSEVRTTGSQAVLDWTRMGVTEENPVVGDLARILTRRNRVVGPPSRVADILEEWQAAGVDGINVTNWHIPGSYQEVIDKLLPELRRRGLAKTAYTPGTLRTKLFGADAHLNDRHPAAAYRGAFATGA
ncbi:LLM class flavin-dependent oxidoreductase [Streptomyces sp. NPDC087420]|uniref:LLM class flavin-dependent oxidoreductase n=1 Tax=Streptomyces sp. NPDC087420 TaxID=3365785 RepID=UPI003832997A